MVSAPSSEARPAMTGAAPVPVPPPRPVVTNTMSASESTSISLSVSSSAARRPMSGSAPAPRPLVSLPPIWMRVGAALLRERLEVGVGDDELDALEAGAHHAVDGVAAAAADADHLDARAGAAGFARASAAAARRARCSRRGRSAVRVSSRHRRPSPSRRSARRPLARTVYPRKLWNMPRSRTTTRANAPPLAGPVPAVRSCGARTSPGPTAVAHSGVLT